MDALPLPAEVALPSGSSIGRRLAFRFSCAFFAVYVFPFPLGLFALPGTDRLWRLLDAAWSLVLPFVGARVFHLGAVQLKRNGSGDQLANWLQMFCMLALAAAIAAGWTAVTRAESHPRLQAALRICIRYRLGATMLTYGALKLVPLQMPAPNFARLMEPYGQSSPMGLLWTFIGASSAYSFFCGFGEVAGGALLFFRRTTLLGALVLCAVLGNVVVLNFCYDVPVKIFSVTLLAMAIFLAAPHALRLADLFVFQRPVEPAPEPELFESKRWRRIALALQVVCLLAIGRDTVRSTSLQVKSWQAPDPQQCGLYEVAEFSKDGAPAAGARWERVAIDSYKGPLAFGVLAADGSMHRWSLTMSAANKTFSLSPRPPEDREGELSFTEPDADRLILDGAFGGGKLHAVLRRVKEPHFLLLERGFHWVNEAPFNR